MMDFLPFTKKKDEKVFPVYKWTQSELRSENSRVGSIKMNCCPGI
jgi:hypothetical protein